MKTVVLTFPDEIENIIQGNLEIELKLLLIIKLLEESRISTGKAAELLGVDKETLLYLLSAKKINIFDENTIKEDLDLVKDLEK